MILTSHVQTRERGSLHHQSLEEFAHPEQKITKQRQFEKLATSGALAKLLLFTIIGSIVAALQRSSTLRV